ncbi:MAG: PQQ-dependent sugar dehydrogenase, partial [Bacteroidota bacterium]
MYSMFAVLDDYDYNNPICQNAYTCRPNVAPSSIGIYESDAVPSWKNSLLVTSLKRGQVYRLKLDETGTAITGDTLQLFYSGNRYRDIAISPDGKAIYLITDQAGNITDRSGLNLISGARNPGNILKFTLDEEPNSTAEPVNNFVRIWPNPAAQSLFVELENVGAGQIQAELINVKGQRFLLPTTLTSGVNEVDLGEIPSGVYILRCYNKKRSWRQRLVVQRR